MTDPSPVRCGYEWPGLARPEWCCWRKTWDDFDRCIWHAETDAEKPAEELECHRETPENRERNRSGGRSAELLDGAHLPGVDLTEVGSFEGCMLQGADLSWAHLLEADLSGADLTNANLFDANLRRTDLRDANLQEVDLPDADLQDAILSGAGHADLSSADLQNADLPGANLRDVNLTDTNLDNTNLSRANIEGASLSHADLDQTNLTDARLYNCRLQDVYISDDTTFGTRCAYECAADPWAGRPPGYSLDADDIENIDKAASIYRTYQRLHRENSLPGAIPKYYYREREMRRIKARAEAEVLNCISQTLQWWVMGYGERPWRVVRTSLLVIIGFGLVYPFFSGMEAIDTETVPFRFVESVQLLAKTGWTRIVFENLYFSAVTFTTLGYGDIQPGGDTVQLLASIESFLGALLMALLVAVLTRRTMR